MSFRSKRSFFLPDVAFLPLHFFLQLAVFLLLIICQTECRPSSSNQPRNLISIIPGGKGEHSTAPLPEARIFISSPSEQYPQFRKQRQQQNSDNQQSGQSLPEHYFGSRPNYDQLLSQHIPLYRDDGSSSFSSSTTSNPSFSRQYLMAESSNSRGYSSSSSSTKGDYQNSKSYSKQSNYADQQGPIKAAVMSRHKVSYYDVPSTSEPQKPTTIEVGAGQVPLNILFRSASSNLNIQQVHDGAQGSTQETESLDEPHLLKHSVTKPIIQELHEIIQPFRFIKQELQPVQEQIETIVAREQGKEYTTQSKQSDYSSEYSSNSYQAENPPAPAIVTSSVQHIVQAPEYQQSSSQVATITKVHEESHHQVNPNSYQAEPISVIRSSQEAEQKVEPEPEEYFHHQQQLIDQIGNEYMTASSNALLSSVYGISAYTSPSSGSGFRQWLIQPAASAPIEQQQSVPNFNTNNHYTAIDDELARQYLPLVYEVMNSMEDNQFSEEENGGRVVYSSTEV